MSGSADAAVPVVVMAGLLHLSSIVSAIGATSGVDRRAMRLIRAVRDIGLGAVMNMGEDRKRWNGPPRSSVLIQINNRKDSATGAKGAFFVVSYGRQFLTKQFVTRYKMSGRRHSCLTARRRR